MPAYVRRRPLLQVLLRRLDDEVLPETQSERREEKSRTRHHAFEKMKPGIKLMADYHCSPLWHHGGSKVGNIDPVDLGVSEALASKLAAWAASFDSHLNISDPASTSWTEEEEHAFEVEGHRLCRELASEMGERFSIVYSSRCIPVEALDTQTIAPVASGCDVRAKMSDDGTCERARSDYVSGGQVVSLAIHYFAEPAFFDHHPRRESILRSREHIRSCSACRA